MSDSEAVVTGQGSEAGTDYSIVVAGIGITLRSQGMSLRREPRRRIFEAHPPKDGIQLRVNRRGLRAESPGKLVFDSEMVWRLYNEGEERVFKFWLPRNGATPYKELRIGRDYREGEIVVNESWQGSRLQDPLEYPLDELLLVHRLGQGLGCELHACGIVDDSGLGWLFVGHSGAGKSTLAKLWAGRKASVLSDDRIILREIDGDIRIFGTPWNGEPDFASAESAPLAGVLVIGHGADNHIDDLDSISTVSELMARSIVPFHDVRALETTIDLLGSAAEKLPCCRFLFKPDESAIDHLSSWMRSVAHA